MLDLLKIRRDKRLELEFKKREPWVTKFSIGGKVYGGFFDPTPDSRPVQFFEAFSNAERILELGSLEGGHSFILARHPSVKQLLGIEGRQYNVDKARFVQRLLKIKNVEFMTANLETCDFSLLGTFDAVFCCGLLYHLPEPWKLIEQIARVSPRFFLSTHYASEERANTTAHGLKGLMYQELGFADPLSGLSPASFWPTLDGLQQLLREYGFTSIRLVDDNPDHPHGPIINLAASIEE